MESEEGRREYLAFPTSKSPGGGQKGRKELLKGNGRRIDYMLHGEEHVRKALLVRPESHGWKVLHFTKQLQVLSTHQSLHKLSSSSQHSLGHPGKYTEDKTWTQPWKVDAERDPGRSTRLGVQRLRLDLD